MKTILTLLAGIFLLMNSMIAQPPPPPDGPGNEKIEALKIGFITKRLNLTPEESQRQWPVNKQKEA